LFSGNSLFAATFERRFPPAQHSLRPIPFPSALRDPALKSGAFNAIDTTGDDNVFPHGSPKRILDFRVVGRGGDLRLPYFQTNAQQPACAGTAFTTSGYGPVAPGSGILTLIVGFLCHYLWDECQQF
jgi:hypothetical protein